MDNYCIFLLNSDYKEKRNKQHGNHNHNCHVQQQQEGEENNIQYLINIYE